MKLNLIIIGLLVIMPSLLCEAVDDRESVEACCARQERIYREKCNEKPDNYACGYERRKLIKFKS